MPTGLLVLLSLAAASEPPEDLPEPTREPASSADWVAVDGPPGQRKLVREVMDMLTLRLAPHGIQVRIASDAPPPGGTHRWSVDMGARRGTLQVRILDPAANLVNSRQISTRGQSIADVAHLVVLTAVEALAPTIQATLTGQRATAAETGPPPEEAVPPPPAPAPPPPPEAPAPELLTLQVAVRGAGAITWPGARVLGGLGVEGSVAWGSLAGQLEVTAWTPTVTRGVGYAIRLQTLTTSLRVGGRWNLDGWEIGLAAGPAARLLQEIRTGTFVDRGTAWQTAWGLSAGTLLGRSWGWGFARIEIGGSGIVPYRRYTVAGREVLSQGNTLLDLGAVMGLSL